MARPPWDSVVLFLTEERPERLYMIGAQDLIVGVSGFTVRPPEARKKPKVSSFLDANYEKILELKPDLVIGFSDLQAELGAELCRRGVQVHLFNQRSIEEIFDSIELTCAMVGRAEDGLTLTKRLREGLERRREDAAKLPRRVRGFFEEWHEPLISGIRWCSELLELCGGDDVCIESRTQQGAKGRIYAPEEVARPQPRGGHRQLVRAQGEAREDWRPAPGVARRRRREERPTVRGEEPADSAARSRRPDRRRRAAGEDHLSGRARGAPADARAPRGPPGL